ncbi:hypothetical protein Btru_058887 [Bulinus truncatus]|nr:hypothetical protein Btru_058887 [Bulinus truncatus]
MSRSFTQRPSVQTRGRGNITRGRGRAGVQPPRGINAAEHPVGVRPAQQRSLYGSSPTQGSRVNDENQDAQDIDGPYPQPQNVDEDPSRGEFRGAYTVFAPDERRRQKVSQMAQKESVEYAQFKAASSSASFKFVGTVGGGETSEEQARRKQAESVRAQKYNRLQRQQQYKDESKRKEEMEIEQKRAEARLKAEQNALRDQARIADPEDLRKKREQFLNHLEKKHP